MTSRMRPKCPSWARGPPTPTTGSSDQATITTPSGSTLAARSRLQAKTTDATNYIILAKVTTPQTFRTVKCLTEITRAGHETLSTIVMVTMPRLSLRKRVEPATQQKHLGDPTQSDLASRVPSPAILSLLLHLRKSLVTAPT